MPISGRLFFSNLQIRWGFVFLRKSFAGTLKSHYATAQSLPS